MKKDTKKKLSNIVNISIAVILLGSIVIPILLSLIAL
jgi:hypothetical protein